MRPEDLQSLPGFGPFRLDVENSVLYRDVDEIPLTLVPFRVLAALYEHKKGLSFDGFRRVVWRQKEVTERTIRNTVDKVRAVLRPVYGECIRSRSGRGYVLEIPDR